MELTLPDHLPQLAEGDNNPGSGKACIMNAISYLNGDKQISDMPTCVFPPFAKMAQGLNDTICKETITPIHRSRWEGCNLLCPKHTHMMWLLGARLIGTGEAARNAVGTNHWNQARLTIQLGAWAVDWMQPTCVQAIESLGVLHGWLDRKVTTQQVHKGRVRCNDGDCEDEACDMAHSLLRAIDGGSESRGMANDALTEAVLSFDTDTESMEFAYALLAEFDRITGQEHLHQWTTDEFTLVHVQANVPLVQFTG